MGTGLLPGLAWPGAAILSSGGKLGDLSGIDVEPELSRVLALQGSAVLCAAAAWAVLPCQSVQCVWVISDNIINYHKKSADQSPATGCGPVKTSLTWHGESLSRRTSRGCVTWGMSWWWAALWVDPSYLISSPGSLSTSAARLSEKKVHFQQVGGIRSWSSSDKMCVK